MRGTFYPIRVILWWQALLVLLAGCLLGGGLFALILKLHLLPEAIEKEVGSGLIILVTFLVFSLAKTVATVRLTIGITPAGLKLEYERRKLPLFPADRLVPWERILNWETEQGHASAHTISPPVFKVKIENARSVYLFIAEQSQTYQAFLADFSKKIDEINAGKSPYFHINKKPEFHLRKSTCIVMGSMFMALLALFNYAIWFIPHIFPTLIERIGGSLVASALCILMIVVSYRNFKKGQKLAKPKTSH